MSKRILIMVLVIIGSINHKLSAQYTGHNLPKTTWYLKVNYGPEHDSDHYCIDINLAHQRTPYKITFRDNQNFVVTYTDKKGISFVNSGTYSFHESTMDFMYDDKLEIRKDRNGKVVKEIAEPKLLTMSFYDKEEFEIIKGGRSYFQFLFSREYMVIYQKDGTMKLKAKVESNRDNEIHPTLPVSH
jgi:hypothetical protein